MSCDLQLKSHSLTVKVVKFVKAYPLNSREFEVLCEVVQVDKTSFLLHLGLGWSSRGKFIIELFR